jgi:transposase-like protein
VQTETGPLDLAVPRDRNGSFTPQLVPKRQRRLEGFDAQVLSLYARGLSTREIQGHLEELYGTEVSPTLIATITDAVLEDVRTWQARPLASVYPILYFDALFVTSRQEGPVQTKAVYLALGVTMDGEKELLGLWLSESEGAKFWLSVFTELKNRGVQDCLIACVDGLQGLPEAIETVFPKTQVQLCIVHKVRNSLKYVPWKERRAVAADLRALYGAPTLTAAEQALERFADRWDTKYPAISPSWLADWDRLTVFFDYPPAIRRAVYTTNAIESLNYSLRKVLKGRSAFPNDEAILKVLYMCNGLQWKWLRTAINENLGPDYLHLSIPSGRNYLQLRLLLSSWDCNRRRWDHIKCDSPEPPSSACLDARGSICISRERLGGAPVSYISRPGTESVSSHLKAPY